MISENTRREMISYCEMQITTSTGMLEAFSDMPSELAVRMSARERMNIACFKYLHKHLSDCEKQTIGGSSDQQIVESKPAQEKPNDKPVGPTTG
jgi:hypothetical protein